jgi:hypothetical protein
LVEGLCIPYNYTVVDICIGRSSSIINCINNSEFPGNKSSNCKPSEEFENGVKEVNKYI